MHLSRRVLLAIASGSLVYSGMASALGMGDITLHSALNQPLSAEIDLLDVGDLAADDIRVVLASSSDFSRVGVERLDFLQDLTFEAVIDGNRSRIQVASNKPVREPYLNFLVEITRAKSRMLREYTVLLDPVPGSSDAASDVVFSVPQGVAVPLRTAPSQFIPPAELPQATQGKRHRVMSGQSLWTIASLYTRGASVTQSQFMQDIQALNPDAFSGGDAARIKAGADLLLPDSAYADMAALKERPQEPVSAPIAESQPVDAPVAIDSDLADDPVANLRRQLFEELATSREENQQLKQMLVDMQSQLERVSSQLIEQNEAQPVASLPVVSPDEVPQVVAEKTVEQIAVNEAGSFSWQDWTLPGGGVLLSLLLGGLWLGRRNKPEAPEPELVMPVEAQRSPKVLASVAVEMPRQPAQASVSETDVLEAADIYITYGRRDEAVDVLLRGIERTPDQLDIRLRYLGLLAEAGDVDSYTTAAAGFLQVGGARTQLDQLLALHPALATAIAAAEPTASEPLLDPDITFVLDETLDADFLDLSFDLPEQTASLETPDVYTAQPLIDGFDEALTLGELPSLLGNSVAIEVKPTAEELRQLEPNPQHLVRLNQAVAYIKQGNMESACIILETLATEGDEAQRQQVNELLAQIA